MAGRIVLELNFVSIVEQRSTLKRLTDFVVDAALCLTVFNLLKSVCVSKATTVDELRTRVAIAVVVPHWIVACAGSVDLGQVANVLACWFNAGVFAFAFGIEAIGVSAAASIPETTATTVFSIKEVLDGVVVAASSHVAFKTASLLWGVWDLVFTFFEAFSFGFAVSIWAASE